jgi:hypothetical protein
MQAALEWQRQRYEHPTAGSPAAARAAPDCRTAPLPLSLQQRSCAAVAYPCQNPATDAIASSTETLLTKPKCLQE